MCMQGGLPVGSYSSQCMILQEPLLGIALHALTGRVWSSWCSCHRLELVYWFCKAIRLEMVCWVQVRKICILSKASWILHLNCRMKTHQTVDVAVWSVLGLGACVSTVGPESRGERSYEALYRRSLTHGGTLGEDIKDFIARETFVSQLSPPPHSPPASSPSPLSYKSQWPLLFQSPLKEGRGKG